MRMTPTEKAFLGNCFAWSMTIPWCSDRPDFCSLRMDSSSVSLIKGEDFIAYVASHEVPLVVLDIWMEEMTGLEVLARLCAISPQTHVNRDHGTRRYRRADHRDGNWHSRFLD